MQGRGVVVTDRGGQSTLRPQARRLCSSGDFDSSTTGSGARCSAVINPAAPPPMITGN